MTEQEWPRFEPIGIGEHSADADDALNYNKSLLAYHKDIDEFERRDEIRAEEAEKRENEQKTNALALEKARIDLYSQGKRGAFISGRFTLFEAVSNQGHHGGTKNYVDKLIDDILTWNEIADPSQDMTFIINSPGGSVIDGFALYDTIKMAKASSGRNVRTIATGYAASMGGILLQAGDTRVVTPNSWVMIHEIASVAWGKLSEMKDEVAFSESLQDQIINLFLERGVNMPEAEFRETFDRRDWWVDAKGAVSIGVADEIGYI